MLFLPLAIAWPGSGTQFPPSCRSSWATEVGEPAGLDPVEVLGVQITATFMASFNFQEWIARFSEMISLTLSLAWI